MPEYPGEKKMKTKKEMQLDEMIKELRAMGNDVVMSILDKYKRMGLFDD